MGGRRRAASPGGCYRDHYGGGLSPGQLREALELAISNRPGALSGDCIVRERRLRAGMDVWDIHPSSAWNEGPPTDSRLRRLRRASGCTLEGLAAELGEDVSTVALWSRAPRSTTRRSNTSPRSSERTPASSPGADDRPHRPRRPLGFQVAAWSGSSRPGPLPDSSLCDAVLRGGVRTSIHGRH
jgi:hypothetical protein